MKKIRTFNLEGNYSFDLSDLIRTNYNFASNTTMVYVNTTALGLLVKILKEIGHEIEKNDLENL